MKFNSNRRCRYRFGDDAEAYRLGRPEHKAITVGELILCTGLEHEAHHPGQIAAIHTSNRTAKDQGALHI